MKNNRHRLDKTVSNPSMATPESKVNTFRSQRSNVLILLILSAAIVVVLLVRRWAACQPAPVF